MSFFGKLLGNTQHTQSVKHFEPLVAKINALEESFKALSDQELKAKTVEFRRRLGVAPSVSPLPAVAEGAPMQASVEAVIPGDILSEAFAAVREAARRTLGQRHFDVQLIGGMVLDSGAIAEMRTGEGKTLVATLSAYLNALSGKGVHIVTVNDYLSRRDAVWMGQIYDFLGLTVGVINHEASFLYDSSIAPQGAAGTDSGPSSEAGGVPTSPTSYSPPRKDGAGGRSVVPPATIVGEEPVPAKPTGRDTDVRVDHKLDKERDDVGAFKVVHEFLRPCTRREAYAADITYGTNNEFGFDYLRDNLEYSPAALRQRPFNYAIVDEIDSILIDEARTPLIISAPSRDAESTYKQFAALVVSFKENEDYEKDEKRKAISLLPAGIEKAEKALGIDNIYTNAGIKYVHHLETAVRAKALFKRDKEYVVKDNQIVIVDEFTGRLQPGRRWSEGLHQAIEAKEGVVIQQESRTYATITFQNFFRMYPKLSGMTGTAATSSEEFYKVYGLDVYMVPPNVPVVRADKNDQIFRTEPGKFKAIARKVKELHDKGQPVLIGTVSIERNELLSQFLKAEGIPHTMLNAKPEYAEREGETVAQAGKKGAVTIATNMAGRGVDIKLGGNPNTKEAYEEVKRLGGLFVLGTERHEARRIDNQLRGRSGRQGDPGETQFFVSLEDTLMRVFASDTLKSMMGRLGMAEDEPIEHRLISKALESAQEKIEGFNFDSRKHVLEFDDVINTQRSSVYSRRRRLLLGNVDDVEKELFEILGLNDTAASPDGTFSAASLRDSRREIARFSGSTARPENLAISTPLKQSPRLAAENVPS
ncbi:MAG: preprotein translocase subunit SecA, partial [Patescibacteria group bacterium]|nr:preprotein translocase subunit SecA [Patescibacteria group bacterium]